MSRPICGAQRGRTASDDPSQALALAFAECFAQPAGARALLHLRRRFLDRRLPPSSTDSELWYVEGQRSVIAYALTMIARAQGRQASDLELMEASDAG